MNRFLLATSCDLLGGTRATPPSDPAMQTEHSSVLSAKSTSRRSTSALLLKLRVQECKRASPTNKMKH